METEFSISSAILLTGLSRSTIRRAIADGKIPNAYKNSSGVWKIPISGLVSAGFEPKSSTAPQQLPNNDSETIQELESRIEKLESEKHHLKELLAQSQHSTRLAEELAETYKRLITSGPATSSLNTLTPTKEQPNEQPYSAQKNHSPTPSHDQDASSLNTLTTTNEHGNELPSEQPSLWSRLRRAFKPSS